MPVHCGDQKLVLLEEAMECMPCGNSSFGLALEAVVLAVQCTSLAVKLNQLFLPEAKWLEKLGSKVIIKLSGYLFYSHYYYSFDCFVVRT
jgi:hypothetical protein